MKYIVLRQEADGFAVEYPVVFPNSISHKDMHEALKIALDKSMKGKLTAVAAGSLSSLHVGAEGACNGKSDSSMALDSRGLTDDNLLSSNDYLHGIC